MNARYVILRVLMEADSTMVTIENVTGEDGQPDLLVKLDREKIKTTGREAIANFLMRLQVDTVLTSWPGIIYQVLPLSTENPTENPN